MKILIDELDEYVRYSRGTDAISIVVPVGDVEKFIGLLRTVANTLESNFANLVAEAREFMGDEEPKEGVLG